MSTNPRPHANLAKRHLPQIKNARVRIRWSVAVGWLLAVAVLPSVATGRQTDHLEDLVDVTDQTASAAGASYRQQAHRGETPYEVKNLTAISGPSPFAVGCPDGLFDSTNITGHELEPAIAVNPAKPGKSSPPGSRMSVRTRHGATWLPSR